MPPPTCHSDRGNVSDERRNLWSSRSDAGHPTGPSIRFWRRPRGFAVTGRSLGMTPLLRLRARFQKGWDTSRLYSPPALDPDPVPDPAPDVSLHGPYVEAGCRLLRVIPTEGTSVTSDAGHPTGPSIRAPRSLTRDDTKTPVILSEARRGPSRRIPRLLRRLSQTSGDPSTTASLRSTSARDDTRKLNPSGRHTSRPVAPDSTEA
jgi:hypothetical protein